MKERNRDETEGFSVLRLLGFLLVVNLGLVAFGYFRVYRLVFAELMVIASFVTFFGDWYWKKLIRRAP
ncbi:MAG: hypothetical protein Q8R20_00635 [Nanoarchaeota archaeon]|nr:hypothetical protein [Nanoarchaeota archaeon]